jgi:glycosyltransferase involved in cell wall biosynthesis
VNFVAISNSTAADLREIGITNRIHVVHCGIPVRKHAQKRKRVENLVAYVGRVKTYKSIDHFVHAVSAVARKKKIKAVVVGDGDALGNLKSLAKSLSVDIDFPGFVSGSEKDGVYETARVIVQPSIKEGWGLTAIEAQSCGTPVICADSPGLREVVVHEKTGFLYEYGNIDALAAYIIELLDNNKQWQQFSEAARKWANEFSWDRAAEKLESVLGEEIKDSRRY